MPTPDPEDQELDEQEFDPSDIDTVINDDSAIQTKATRASIRKLSVEEKKRMALALRLSGSTYIQIARAMDCDPSTARNYVVGIMKELQLETADNIKQVQFLRLEHMLMLNWPGVQQKNLGSMNMALSIMDRQTRLLGLDSAMKVEIGASEGTTIDVAGDKDAFMKALEMGRVRVQDAIEAKKAEDEADEYIEVEVIADVSTPSATNGTNGHLPGETTDGKSSPPNDV